MPPADASPNAIDADVLITATKFVEYVTPTTYCPYDIVPVGLGAPGADGDGKPIWKFGRVSLHVGQYQKPGETRPTTVRLEKDNKRGVLRFRIAVNGLPANAYHVVGVVFERADGTKPTGIPYSTGKHQGADEYPFGNVRINDPEQNLIHIDLHPTNRPSAKGKDGQPATHRTYRFKIFVQRADTGQIAVIDPEIEDPNVR